MISKGNAPNSAGNNFEFRALTVVDINSQKVFREVTFSWSRRFVCPSSAVGGGIYDIVIDPTGVPEGKTCVILPISFTAVGAGPIFADLYINPTYTLGDELVGLNRDNRSLNNSATKMIQGVTTSDPGAKVEPAEFMIPSNGVSAVANFGGQAKDDLILIANCNQKYMFRLMNQEASPADCVIALTMFEAEANV